MASAAQIAARKLFAARAKAGAFAEMRGGPFAKNRATPATAKKPKKRAIRFLGSVSKTRAKCFVVRDEQAGTDLAQFNNRDSAIEYARAYADSHDKQMSVRPL